MVVYAVPASEEDIAEESVVTIVTEEADRARAHIIYWDDIIFSEDLHPVAAE